MKGLLAIVLILFVCVNISSQYATEPICYNQVCPSGTTNCKKNTRSSSDRRHLEIRINCLDDFDGSLKEYFFQEPSVLNPHTHYESNAYSAASGGSDDYYRGHNALEDFAK